MVYVVLKDATNVPDTITQLLKALTVVPTLSLAFKVSSFSASIFRRFGFASLTQMRASCR